LYQGEFQVGDRAVFLDTMYGRVKMIDPNVNAECPVLWVSDNGLEIWFTLDGRLCPEHKISFLKLYLEDKFSDASV
jgi:hypothetical protein